MRLSPKFLQTLQALCIASCCGVAYGHNPLARAEEPLTSQTSTPLTDEARRVLDAGSAYAKEKQYDKAIESWEKVMAMPLPPGAHKPGGLPYPGPIDWRGEARWNIAETRRAQGRWQEALDLYQINRKEYPRSDGCVFSGAAFQEMVMVEGECLEHLGRTSEAIKPYWIAAVYCDISVAPRAMRRLIKLYSQSGQLHLLKEACEREEEKRILLWLQSWGKTPDEPLDDDMKLRKNIVRASTPLAVFQNICLLQKAFREKNWPTVLAEIENPTALNEDLKATYYLREAAMEFAKHPKILNAALKRAPKNEWLYAALIVSSSSPESEKLLQTEQGKDATSTLAYETLKYYDFKRVEEMTPTIGPLPSDLPLVTGAQIEL